MKIVPLAGVVRAVEWRRDRVAIRGGRLRVARIRGVGLDVRVGSRVGLDMRIRFDVRIRLDMPV
jgi:hypothetical protein